MPCPSGRMWGRSQQSANSVKNIAIGRKKTVKWRLFPPPKPWCGSKKAQVQHMLDANCHNTIETREDFCVKSLYGNYGPAGGGGGTGVAVVAAAVVAAPAAAEGSAVPSITVAVV